jgi:hypothetical protein
VISALFRTRTATSAVLVLFICSLRHIITFDAAFNTQKHDESSQEKASAQSVSGPAPRSELRHDKTSSIVQSVSIFDHYLKLALQHYAFPIIPIE